MTRLRSMTAPVACALALLASASAQQTIDGVEPNQTKAEATLAQGLVAGDKIRSNSCDLFDTNIFRVRTAPLPPGIYRHRLAADSGFAASRVRVYGRDAVLDQAIPNSLAVLADSTSVPTLTSGMVDSVSWYGFGKSEELYADIGTTDFCRNGSAIYVLETEPVTPIDMGVLPATADPTLSVRLQAFDSVFALDPEMHVFDANFEAMPDLNLDDVGSPFGAPFANQPLLPGVYYLAVSDHELASHLPPSSRNFDLESPAEVTDFPGVLVNGSPTSGADFTAQVRRAGTTLTSNGTKVAPFDVVWFRFTVEGGNSPTVFCAGDGTQGPCPCGALSEPGSGMGCPNSTGRGGTLLGMFSPNSAGSRYTFSAEDLPANAGSLLFLGTSSLPGSNAVGGLACLGAGATRAAVAFAGEAGRATFDLNLDSSVGFMAGQTVFAQAAYRDPAAGAGCNVNLTSGVSFMIL